LASSSSSGAVRRLQLSAAGSKLVPWAEQCIAGAGGGTRALSAAQSLTGGEAAFGLMRSSRFYLLSDLLSDFHHEHPRVRVRFIGQNSFEVANSVAYGVLESGIVMLPIDDTSLYVTPLAPVCASYSAIAAASPSRTSRSATG